MDRKCKGHIDTAPFWMLEAENRLPAVFANDSSFFTSFLWDTFIETIQDRAMIDAAFA